MLEVLECACKPFARGGVVVVSHSAVSTLSLTLQAILLFTVQALHLRELSLLLPVSSMSKNSSVSVALLLILYTAKIQQDLLLCKFRTIDFVVSPAIIHLHV